jgi:hypothetical protein
MASPEGPSVRDVILHALMEYPDAHAAVSGRLPELEAGPDREYPLRRRPETETCSQQPVQRHKQDDIHSEAQREAWGEAPIL